MKSKRWGLVILGTVLVLGGEPVAAAKPKTLLRLATVAPEGSTWMQVMRDIDAEVREATDGAVGFKIYAGGVQGDELVVLRKMRSGQLHGGGFTGLGLGVMAPPVRVLEIPFLFENHEQVDLVRDEVGGTLESILDKAGYTLLGWADVGFVYLFSKPPITTDADLKSARMWLWEGDPLAESFFKAAGVVPVPLAITDVLTSLQTGLVDGVYSSPLGCVVLQWFTRVKHYTNLPITFATGAVVVTNKSFDRVPAEHQETVRRICRTRLRDGIERTRHENQVALQEIEKAGVVRVEVDAREAAHFEAMGRSVWQEQVGTLYSKELLQAVVQAAGIERTPNESGASR